MDRSPTIDSIDSHPESITRREYLRSASAAGVGGLGLAAALSRTGVAAAASHTLTVSGTGLRATYTFGVSGDLEKTTANGANINRNDVITGSTASGAVGTGADSYVFSGELDSFGLDGDADVALDGDTLDPKQYPDHVLTLAGTGPRTTYVFSVSDGLEKTIANGANINHNDVIAGSTASGVVGSAADSYTFSDDLASLSIDGDADVVMDGNTLDPNQYPDHVLTIEGTGPRATYAFDVSGMVEKTTANGANSNRNDEIQGSSVSGIVGSAVDSYVFSGELVDFELDGDARVVLDGERFEPTADTLLTIEGRGSRATYAFGVTGDVKKTTANGANLNRNDELSGPRVSGVVGTAADSYAITGSLADFELNGDASVSLDDHQVDPRSFGYDWEEDTSLPAVQSDAGGGVLDGELYVYGGIETGTDLEAVARGFAYDPSKGSRGSWRRIDDLPRRVWGNCGVATETALYSFGGAPPDAPYSGEPPTDVVFKYTPRTGWRNLTAQRGVRCPYPNWVMKGLYNPADGLIYCVGGGTGDHDAPTASDHGFHGEDVPGTYDERRIWTYDPDAERVANPDLARMPEAKRWTTVALVEVDGRQYIHALGGLLGTGGPTDSNFRYDIEASRFEKATPLPMQGTYGIHENPVIANEVYLTHGQFWHGRPTIDRYKRVAHRYDPVRDTFATDLPNPKHRRGGAIGGVIDGTLYVVGGHLKRFERNDLHDCTAYNEGFSFST